MNHVTIVLKNNIPNQRQYIHLESPFADENVTVPAGWSACFEERHKTGYITMFVRLFTGRESASVTISLAHSADLVIVREI